MAATRTVQVKGRILFLTEDLSLVEEQLTGKDLDFDPSEAPRSAPPRSSVAKETPLIGNISTDEITPGWVCYYYDETLARYCLVGLRGGKIGRDAIKDGGFGVIVSGISKGCGSSRETAPYSEREAGVQIVVARNVEKIYKQNCQNIGLLTTTDFSIIDRVERGE